MEHKKNLSCFSQQKTKFDILGFAVTLFGICLTCFFFYERLVSTPFEVLYSSELTKSYHIVLAVISSLVAWRLISHLPFIALNSLKADGDGYKPMMAYLIASGLIIYIGLVIAYNLALTYLYNFIP